MSISTQSRTEKSDIWAARIGAPVSSLLLLWSIWGLSNNIKEGLSPDLAMNVTLFLLASFGLGSSTAFWYMRWAGIKSDPVSPAVGPMAKSSIGCGAVFVAMTSFAYTMQLTLGGQGNLQTVAALKEVFAPVELNCLIVGMGLLGLNVVVEALRGRGK